MQWDCIISDDQYHSFIQTKVDENYHSHILFYQPGCQHAIGNGNQQENWIQQSNMRLYCVLWYSLGISTFLVFSKRPENYQWKLLAFCGVVWISNEVVDAIDSISIMSVVSKFGISHPVYRWGWVMYISISKLTIIGSDNGLSPGRYLIIIRTSAGILLIGTSGTNFSEILSEIHIFSFKKMHLEIVA